MEWTYAVSCTSHIRIEILVNRYVPYRQFLITHGYNLPCPRLGLFHWECFEIERYRSEALIFCLLVCAILTDCRHVHVISNYQRTTLGSLSSLFTVLREVFHFCLAVCFRLAGLGASVWFFPPPTSLSEFMVRVMCYYCIQRLIFFFNMSLRDWTENSCLQSRYCYLLSFLSLRTTGGHHGTLWIAKPQELWRLNLVTTNWLICSLCFSHILEVCLPEALPFTLSPSGSALRISL